MSEGFGTSLRSLKPERKLLSADATAGLTFAIVNIPQGMANALLAGVNPVLGLYTLMIATPVGALVAGSVFMNISTTSALSVAAGDALLGVPDSLKVQNLVTLVLLTGIVQIVMGLFRLGTLLRFVSNSVMVGFTNGVAVLIILGQLDDFTGYDSRFSGKLLQLADLLLNLRQIDWLTLAIGLVTVALILLFGKSRFSKGAMILALLGSILLARLLSLPALGLGSIAFVGDIATIPEQLLRFVRPDLVLTTDLIISAVALAILGLVQGAGVSQSYPNPDGKYSDVSRDFLGQGAANVATSFFQGIPAGGSMSGTAVTVGAGAQTRWANIFAGLFIAPLVLVIGDLVGLIPMAALAGLLIVIGVQSLRPDSIRTVWQTGQISRVAMGLTFAATLILPLQFAVFIGVAVSVMLSVFQASSRIRLVQLELVPNGFPVEKPVVKQLRDHTMHLFFVYGSIFFAAASTLEKQLPDPTTAKGAVVLLGLRGQEDVGSTFIQVIRRYHSALAADGGKLILVGVREDVWKQLERTGMIKFLGSENVIPAAPRLGVAMNEAIEVAQMWLDGRAAVLK
jgi:SulP family sulfate permease